MSLLDRANVLVTGGIGAIGSALCRSLLKQPISSLSIIDDCSSSREELTQDILADSRVMFTCGSITDDTSLAQAFDSSPRVVFHLAAHFANQNSVDHPLEDCMVNSIGTLKVLEAARKAHTRKFLYASSSCIYGNAPSSSVGTHVDRLDTPYAISKLHGEYLVQFYHHYHGMDAVILRYFNSFGPGELPGRYRNVIPNFFALAMQGKPLPITGDETTSRDFNYIENAVEATFLATESPQSAGKAYNVGSGQEVRIIELAKMINDITGNTAGMTLQPVRHWDTIHRRYADISRTTGELGYHPIIDLSRQLRETYEWLNTNQSFFPEFP